MKKLLLLTSLLTLSNLSHALISMNIEPIVGYERVQKLIPERHTKDRLVYGARLSLGIPLVSVEASYLRANDTEDFTDLGLSIKDTTDKAQLGLRSSIKLLGVLRASARAGGQASLNVHEETLNGVTRKDIETLKVHPYAGAGLIFQLGKLFQFRADLTTVFVEFPNFNNNEYQLTAGFAVKFP